MCRDSSDSNGVHAFEPRPTNIITPASFLTRFLFLFGLISRWCVFVDVMVDVCRYSVISGNSGALLTPSAPQHRGVSLGSRQKRFRVHPGETARLPSLSWSKPKRRQHTGCFPPVPQVNCISTEFTPRKHGGEKGVPFRIQVDTFTTNDSGEYMEHVHSSSCQVKVFKVNSSSASCCVTLVVPSMTPALFLEA